MKNCKECEDRQKEFTDLEKRFKSLSEVDGSLKDYCAILEQTVFDLTRKLEKYEQVEEEKELAN